MLGQKRLDFCRHPTKHYNNFLALITSIGKIMRSRINQHIVADKKTNM